jgi:hypothetical protein
MHWYCAVELDHHYYSGMCHISGICKFMPIPDFNPGDINVGLDFYKDVD